MENEILIVKRGNDKHSTVYQVGDDSVQVLDENLATWNTIRDLFGLEQNTIELRFKLIGETFIP